MIVVQVTLLSAVTGKAQELARMEIANDGDHPNHRRGNYSVRTLKGRSTGDLNRRTTQREAKVKDHARLALHVWNLVAKALKAMRYGDEA